MVTGNANNQKYGRLLVDHDTGNISVLSEPHGLIHRKLVWESADLQATAEDADIYYQIVNSSGTSGEQEMHLQILITADDESVLYQLFKNTVFTDTTPTALPKYNKHTGGSATSEWSVVRHAVTTITDGDAISPLKKIYADSGGQFSSTGQSRDQNENVLEADQSLAAGYILKISGTATGSVFVNFLWYEVSD